MRCYFVLVHGRLQWNVAAPDGSVQPLGFYCHRYVLASSEQRAAETAFRRVHANFDRRFRWLSDGSATLVLEAEEICAAPILKLIEPDNGGHSFYDQD